MTVTETIDTASPQQARTIDAAQVGDSVRASPREQPFIPSAISPSGAMSNEPPNSNPQIGTTQAYDMARFHGAAATGAGEASNPTPRLPIENLVSMDLSPRVASLPSSIELQTLQLWGCFDVPKRSVRQSLLETFLFRCYPWAPVVDVNDLEPLQGEPASWLLAQAVFLAASRVSSAPGITSFATPRQFYERAKTLFYLGHEVEPLKIISAAIMLQWMNSDGPEQMSLDSSSFWLSIAVGLARQVGLQIEPPNGTDRLLRRRIWWTLVARDSLLSAAHGRPRAINLEDCATRRPCLDDFPKSQSQALLFRAYVEICIILGDLAECCARKTMSAAKQASLEHGLFTWIWKLPPELRLSRQTVVAGQSTLAPYDFSARQLHLPFLVTLLIKARCQSGALDPISSPIVVLSSSFVAGIFEDFLARDEVQYLGPIVAFYLLAAGVSLASVRSHHPLYSVVQEDLGIIRHSLEELAKRWPSALGVLRAVQRVSDVRGGDSTSYTTPVWLDEDEMRYFEGFSPHLCRLWEPYRSQCGDCPSENAREERNETTAISHHNEQPTSQIAQSTDESEQYASDPFAYNGVGNWLLSDWNGDLTWP